MNRNQWFKLSIGFVVIQTVFISMDALSPLSCGVPGQPLDTAAVWCIVNTEMYDPFIWFTGFLWILFVIMGFLEPKK